MRLTKLQQRVSGSVFTCPALRAMLPYTLKIQGGTSWGLPAKKNNLFPIN